MQRSVCPPVFERIVAALSYLTVGVFGLIWFFVYAALLKKKLSDFLTINFIQSFLIMFMFGIFNFIYNILFSLVSPIPFIGDLSKYVHVALFSTPLYGSLVLGNAILFCFLGYLGVWSFLGKLPYIPYLTDLAKRLKQ